MTRKELLAAFGTLVFLVALVVVANFWSRIVAGAIGAVALAAVCFTIPRATWREIGAKQKEREKTIGGKVLRWVELLALLGGFLLIAIELVKKYA